MLCDREITNICHTAAVEVLLCFVYYDEFNKTPLKLSVILSKPLANYRLFVVVADCKDGLEDTGCNNVSATNSILLSLLTDRLRNTHDIELPLCDHDSAHIVKLLCARSCGHTDYVLRPCVPIRFRCYVRILSSSHLVLTVVPATHDDMVAVMSTLDSLNSMPDSATDGATGQDKSAEAVAETVNCDRIPADLDLYVSKNVEQASDNLNNSRCEANVEANTSMPSVDAAVGETMATDDQHSTRLPVFVFDCLLNLVSQQLVHQSTADRPPDIVEDFTDPVMAATSKHVDI